MNGGDLVREDEPALDAARLEQRRELPAPLVVAHHCDEHGRRAERCEIQRDVGGAAGALLGSDGIDHRDRRFRRNTAGVAEPILVEHRVSGDENAKTGKIRNVDRQESSSAAVDAELILAEVRTMNRSRIRGRRC